MKPIFHTLIAYIRCLKQTKVFRVLTGPLVTPDSRSRSDDLETFVKLNILDLDLKK